MLFSLVYVAMSVVSLIPTVVGAPVICICPADKGDGAEFLCGDKRLGPKVLPDAAELKPLLVHYNQLGGLCPEEWLAKYTWPNGSYHYPEFDGFELFTKGVPIEQKIVLPKGTLIDRFGPPSGKFLSPAHTPVKERSLPPNRLNPGLEFHIYEVLTELHVNAGPAAPAFGQPGLGIQYQLEMGVEALLNKNLTEIKH